MKILNYRSIALGASALVFMGQVAVAGSSTVLVHSTAQLLAALKTAKGGSTIQLAPGTYTGVVIANDKFSQAVTITSQDPNNPATLVGFGLANSSGLNISNLEMTSVGSKDPYYAFRVSNSQNVNFSGLNVHGATNAAPSTQITGFYFNASSNITLSNSQLHNLNSAIVTTNSSNMSIANNTFDLLNKGGVQFGGSSGISITNNTFTDFKVSRGTHPDAIQFYTAGTTTAASNITITGNQYTRGNGDPIQGIFIRDETGHLPFQNLNVSNNAIIGGMWDSIYIEHANNTTVNNNVIATWPGLDPADAGATGPISTTAFKGFLYLKGDIGNLTEKGNIVQVYLDGLGHQMNPPTGNTGVGTVTDNGSQLLAAWLASQGVTPTRPNGTAFRGVRKDAVADLETHTNVSFPTGNAPMTFAADLDQIVPPQTKLKPNSLIVSQAAVAAVPEPSTWAILLFGFFGVGSAIRRSNRHKKPVACARN